MESLQHDALEQARYKGLLESLQQQDPEIDTIIVHSKFVVAYLLQQEGPNPGWRKADIEGPLYLVRRQTLPRYQLFVKNQYNKTDLLDHLHSEWELDCQKNYVFYKVEDPVKRIRGLWFHDDTERRKLESALEKTLDDLRARPAEQHMQPQSLTPQMMVSQGEGSVEGVSTANHDTSIGHTKPLGDHATSAKREQQSGRGSGDRVTVSRDTLRMAFHALADDDAFVGAIMQKLKDHQPFPRRP